VHSPKLIYCKSTQRCYNQNCRTACILALSQASAPPASRMMWLTADAVHQDALLSSEPKGGGCFRAACGPSAVYPCVQHPCGAVLLRYRTAACNCQCVPSTLQHEHQRVTASVQPVAPIYSSKQDSTRQFLHTTRLGIRCVPHTSLLRPAFEKVRFQKRVDKYRQPGNRRAGGAERLRIWQTEHSQGLFVCWPTRWTATTVLTSQPTRLLSLQPVTTIQAVSTTTTPVAVGMVLTIIITHRLHPHRRTRSSH
jgi:hypothetical protein